MRIPLLLRTIFLKNSSCFKKKGFMLLKIKDSCFKRKGSFSKEKVLDEIEFIV